MRFDDFDTQQQVDELNWYDYEMFYSDDFQHLSDKDFDTVKHFYEIINEFDVLIK